MKSLNKQGTLLSLVLLSFALPAAGLSKLGMLRSTFIPAIGFN
jgi:hypothetical protein